MRTPPSALTDNHKNATGSKFLQVEDDALKQFYRKASAHLRSELYRRIPFQTVDKFLDGGFAGTSTDNVNYKQECPQCERRHNRIQYGDSAVKIIACGHVFRGPCLVKYVIGTSGSCNKCPVCRTKLFESVNDERYDQERQAEQKSRDLVCSGAGRSKDSRRAPLGVPQHNESASGRAAGQRNNQQSQAELLGQMDARAAEASRRMTLGSIQNEAPPGYQEVDAGIGEGIGGLPLWSVQAEAPPTYHDIDGGTVEDGRCPPWERDSHEVFSMYWEIDSEDERSFR